MPDDPQPEQELAADQLLKQQVLDHPFAPNRGKTSTSPAEDGGEVATANASESVPTPKLREISSLQDFITVLSSQTVETPWFRGQVNAGWLLTPRLRRNRGWAESGTYMLKKFKQVMSFRAHELPASDWEWICLAQHYGLPTQLLDWSENPLIALYFAVAEDSENDGSDGRVFMLDPEDLNGPPGRATKPYLLGERETDDYNIELNSGFRPRVAVLARWSFARIHAQSGVFTLEHKDQAQSLGEVDTPALQSWIIRAVDKAHIRQQLRQVNVHAATVYPDPSFVADDIRDRYRR